MVPLPPGPPPTSTSLVAAFQASEAMVARSGAVVMGVEWQAASSRSIACSPPAPPGPTPPVATATQSAKGLTAMRLMGLRGLV